MKPWPVVVILLVLMLAGCLGGDDAEDADVDLPDDDGEDGEDGQGEPEENETAPPPRGLLLEDLKECDFLYPDGETPVPCDPTFDELQVVSEERPGTITTFAEQQTPWVCVDQTDEPEWGYSIHWDPELDRYGMYYEFDDPGLPVSAVFYKEDGSVGASFHNKGDSGFILLPEVDRTDDTQMLSSVQFVFYTHNHITDTPGLQGGQIKAIWSHYNGTVYPLQVIEAGGETYYLHNVTQKPAGADAYTYHIQAPMLEGEDFNVTVQSFELKRLNIGWNPRPALCSIV